MHQGGQRKAQAKPNLLNPKLFQRPNSIPVTIKPPSLLSSEKSPPLPSKIETSSPAIRPPTLLSSVEFPPLPSDIKTSPPVIRHDDEECSDPPVWDQQHPSAPLRIVPVSSGHLEIEARSGGATAESRNWRPDVFAQNFVSKAYSEINDAPAVQSKSQGGRDVDYAAYVSNFASPLFLPPRDVPKAPPISSTPLIPLDHLDTQNYGRHFNDCVIMDVRAQTMEVRSYDLFGVPLGLRDPTYQYFNLHIPGLRENTPKVVYGDPVVLRQLLFEPGSSLPKGMDSWINRGGRQRGRFS